MFVNQFMYKHDICGCMRKQDIIGVRLGLKRPLLRFKFACRIYEARQKLNDTVLQLMTPTPKSQPTALEEIASDPGFSAKLRNSLQELQVYIFQGLPTAKSDDKPAWWRTCGRSQWQGIKEVMAPHFFANKKAWIFAIFSRPRNCVAAAGNIEVRGHGAPFFPPQTHRHAYEAYATVQGNLGEEQKLESEMHYVNFSTILSPCQVPSFPKNHS